ncbi:MAG TPA: Clp protease N-terminal domain-containing protein [Acidimicrobiales bacterium]|nr:Clp protease N-terminal domain-containing protein [Acidimicrobiales bacterium]
MFERFTDRARRVLVLANEESRLLNHNFIGTEHILLGLLDEGEGVAAKALESAGVSPEAARDVVEEIIGPARSPVTGSPPFTPRAKHVLELSLREALALGHNYIGTEHLLLGVIREGGGVAVDVLVGLGADLVRLRQEVLQLLAGWRAEGGPPAGEPRFAPGGPRRRPLVSAGPGVSAVQIPIDPTALVTRDDVEEVLEGAARPALAQTSVRDWGTEGVAYRSCDFIPKPFPLVTVSVAGAEVDPEAFEASLADRGEEPVEGLGDAAAFSGSAGVLRVRSGSLVFAVVVLGHDDARSVAVALARKAIQRLGDAR